MFANTYSGGEETWLSGPCYRQTLDPRHRSIGALGRRFGLAVTQTLRFSRQKSATDGSSVGRGLNGDPEALSAKHHAQQFDAFIFSNDFPADQQRDQLIQDRPHFRIVACHSRGRKL